MGDFMITVDVLRPIYGDILKVYCEEDILTDCLVEHVMALNRQELPEEDHLHHHWLCHIENRNLLCHHKTLLESGIIDGSSLIMV